MAAALPRHHLLQHNPTTPLRTVLILKSSHQSFELLASCLSSACIATAMSWAAGMVCGTLGAQHSPATLTSLLLSCQQDITATTPTSEYSMTLLCCSPDLSAGRIRVLLLPAARRLPPAAGQAADKEHKQHYYGRLR